MHASITAVATNETSTAAEEEELSNLCAVVVTQRFVIDYSLSSRCCRRQREKPALLAVW
jgi:hypothetical protein